MKQQQQKIRIIHFRKEKLCFNLELHSKYFTCQILTSNKPKYT